MWEPALLRPRLEPQRVVGAQERENSRTLNAARVAVCLCISPWNKQEKPTMSKFDPVRRLHLQVFANRTISVGRGSRILFASGCLGFIAFHAVAANAQPSPCARIAEPMARLACYDERERNEAARRVQDTAPAAPAAPAAVEPVGSAAGRFASSALENRWELRPELQRGTFNLVPHRSVYGLVHWASDANEQPGTPTRSFSERVELDRAEAKIQLSFKSKVVQDLFASEGDIWIGYTQVSYWQAGNSRNSSPFRETNYEPEAMFVQPLRINLGPLRFRMASIGLNHQSNGRSEPLSRSWNRITGELAAEWGAWSFHVRPWKRLFESNGEGNDNPDIEDFMGRAEVAIVRRAHGHVLTLAGRHSLRSGARSHGSVRLDWSFPLAGSLNGHVQAFSGYGQNLIDYNHRQTTLGLGISFFD